MTTYDLCPLHLVRFAGTETFPWFEPGDVLTLWRKTNCQVCLGQGLPPKTRGTATWY